MIEPRERILDTVDCCDLRQRRPGRHDHGKTELARGCDFAIGCGAAAVLGNHNFDAVSTQKRAIIGFGEGAATGDVARVRNGKRRIDGVDAAHEIMVLRRVHEGSKLLAAEGEKDPARRDAKRGYRRPYVCDLDPAVAGNRTPGRPPQRQQRQAGGLDGARGVGGNGGRVRMGCVNERIDAFSREIVRKAVGAPEATDTHRHRLRRRRGGAAGKRQRHREIGAAGKAFGKASGFRRAAENEDAHGKS
jgi:hypothetical protein